MAAFGLDTLPPELATAFQPIVASILNRADAMEKRMETFEKNIVERFNGATVTVTIHLAPPVEPAQPV